MPIFMRYAPIVLWFVNLSGLVVASIGCAGKRRLPQWDVFLFVFSVW